ncbi:THUMP domain-containing class I SAM-dependent RNA methyltransferase [Jannaschia donghaensis]|uniref:Ribosomal RNA large subunit methyltransferase L n=1 Tax=Jannaschia donghaensis TaxID=420998 RepID=A0A0M6YK25_9RHOB|nr:RNA methyltransferase [Jannaschia donghaensis]CTQ50025.1 Ribosomal RNA large subunit methyltransferase L [Jannaschia donghaensis]
MTFEIFLMAPPGLEQTLAAEAAAAEFADLTVVPGGVIFQGGWPDVWRANLTLRGAGRVLARIGEFRAFHLAQLDKRSRKFPWGDILRADIPVRVEVATNRKSKIYHAGAAQERIERAIAEELGAPIDPKAEIVVRARIDDNMVGLSVDTSGGLLHKRGHKQAVGKAPLRETMAAMFLAQCGYDGSEPVLDPMCGSGTFVIEAAEIATGLLPGRARSFAFERLASFDADAWAEMKADAPAPRATDLRFHGSDRDAGSFAAARENAERAGVADLVDFQKRAVSEITAPDGPPGLVIVNPPYGIRVGNKKPLYGLHGALGAALKDRFAGWRVGIVTSEASLAQATGLPFLPTGHPVAHGGLRVTLFRTDPLP